MSLEKKIEAELLELENMILEHDAKKTLPIDYSEDSFRAIVKIFMSSMLTNTWKLQLKEKMDFEDQLKMAEKLGKELKKIIFTYTGIKTEEMY